MNGIIKLLGFGFLYFFLSANCLRAQSLDFDIRMGEQAAEQIKQEMGHYKHPVTSAYVQQIGDRLIQHLKAPKFEYNFTIVEMKEPNAFALPAGHIYISRGLLCLTNTEDEIAGILGHEIVHSELRHSVKQMRKAIIPAILQIPGELVGVFVNEQMGSLINTPIAAGNELFLASYSRKHEREADAIGAKLMASAGYDATHLPQVLHNLSVLIKEITGEEEEFSYFDSHPYTPRRVSDLHKEIATLEYPQKPGITTTKEDYLKRITGIIVGDNPAHGIFRENKFLHPDLKLCVEFPKEWITDNKPTVVGALDKDDNQNIIVLGMAKENNAPAEIAEGFVKNLDKEHGIKPDTIISSKVNGIPAYWVKITDNSGRNPVVMQSMWFRLNEVSYQVIGVSKPEKTETINAAFQTVRPITQKEADSIEVKHLGYAKANTGESIGAFNKRTGNIWNVELTAAMNNVKKDVKLESGQLLKIVTKERYIK